MTEQEEHDFEHFSMYCTSLIVGYPAHCDLVYGGTVSFNFENCLRKYLVSSMDINKPCDDKSFHANQYMSEFSTGVRDQYFFHFTNGVQRGCEILKSLHTENTAECKVDTENRKITVVFGLN